jgi:hypothetical protein
VTPVRLFCPIPAEVWDDQGQDAMHDYMRSRMIADGCRPDTIVIEHQFQPATVDEYGPKPAQYVVTGRGWADEP